jgi:predicted GIY-YIG superfamily endonuclease
LLGWNTAHRVSIIFRNNGHWEPIGMSVQKPNKKPEPMDPKTWFVYVLRCADGSLYTGIAKDVLRRSNQHNAGTASRYTRSRLPVQVEYQEPQTSRSAASKREWAIKAMSRREKELLIQRSNVSLKLR